MICKWIKKMVKKYTRNLIGHQDLALGPGTVTQVRGGIDTEVGQMELMFIFRTAAEIKALDPYRFDRVALYSVGPLKELYWDATATDTPDDVTVIKPNSILVEDPGRWLRTATTNVIHNDTVDRNNGTAHTTAAIVGLDDALSALTFADWVMDGEITALQPKGRITGDNNYVMPSKPDVAAGGRTYITANNTVPITITLPSSAQQTHGAGDTVTIQKITASALVTIDGNGDTINGQSQVTLTNEFDSVVLTAENSASNWIARFTRAVEETRTIHNTGELDYNVLAVNDTIVFVDAVSAFPKINLPATPLNGQRVYVIMTNEGASGCSVNFPNNDLYGLGYSGNGIMGLGPVYDSVDLIYFDQKGWMAGDTSSSNTTNLANASEAVLATRRLNPEYFDTAISATSDTTGSEQFQFWTCTNTGPITLSFNTGHSTGDRVTVIRQGTGAVTIDADTIGGTTVNGATTVSLPLQYDSATFMYTSTGEWIAI